MATKDGIYDYAGTIEVPSKAQDKLAHITISRFNDAVRWQMQEQIGGKPLRTVLRECYDQYNGILAPRDVEIAQAIGVDAYVNITAMKSALCHRSFWRALYSQTRYRGLFRLRLCLL